MAALGDEKYILLTTFRRDGRAVSTPVWNVDLGEGKIGFWTSSGSGKTKRLAHTPRVTVQACDARGNPLPRSKPVEATARVVTGAELEEIAVKVRAKYGVMTKITKVLNSIGGFFKRNRIPYADRGVVITPSDAVPEPADID